MVAANIHEIYVIERKQGDVPYMDTAVVLKAHDQERYLPIWIAYPQAIDIAVHLHGPQMQHRPSTYELMAQLVERSGARVEAIDITSLQESVYHATLRLMINGKSEEVDCRPSDALGLALSVNAPIFVAADMLAREGFDEPTVFAAEGVVQPLALNAAA